MGQWPLTSVTVCSLKFFQLDAALLKVSLPSVLVPLAWAALLSLVSLKISMQQLTRHARIVHSDEMSHPSQLGLMSKASMPVHSARSKTSRFVIRSCQHISSMERRARK